MPARADAYLTIPAEYGCALGGLRWSPRGDAIEAADGTALALTEQLGQVLEGVFAGGPRVPPLAFVLNLLIAFKHGRLDGGPAELLRLKAACERGAPAGAGRNAGVLTAELCRHLPPAADPPTWPELRLALTRQTLFGERLRPELAEVPTLDRAGFEAAVARELHRFDTPTLVHWLRTGEPPNAAGDRLAEEVLALPAGGAGLLEVVRTRPRLVGAAALAPALDAALTLPPRKPRPDRLPVGGYADVTTRGDPDRLLPSQFALDADEFVRRYAERELLYFLREEPRQPDAAERWLVLDQGVRTWGGVRLALAAGVLTVLDKGAKRAGPVRLAVTSCEGPLDPAALGPDALADHLEASDLTRHPGAALGRVLDEPPADGAAGRDVILFTHPRAMLEPEVRAAAGRRRPDDRLFALTVNDAGRAEWGEWSPGGFLPTRRFRVNLAAAEAAKVAGPTPARAPRTDPDRWTGDVEPVPFPFRCGLVSDVAHVGFDAAGRWVVAVGRDGCVQARPLDADEPVEVLPRAYRQGEVLTRVDAVLGVNGGVAVCGRMPARLFPELTSDERSVRAAEAAPDALAVAHYDFAGRTVRLLVIGWEFPAVRWAALPSLHAVASTSVSGEDALISAAVDLGTGEAAAVDDRTQPISTRVEEAALRALALDMQPCELRVFQPHGVSSRPPPGPWAVLASDTVIVHRIRTRWATLRPMAEGKPLLNGMTLNRAYLAADVFAAHVTTGHKRHRLLLLRGPDAAVLNDVHTGGPHAAFRVSADGDWYAVQAEKRTVRVRPVGSAPGPLRDLVNAGLHTRSDVGLSLSGLRVRVGRFDHWFPLTGEFKHVLNTDEETGRSLGDPTGYDASDVCYDQHRFLNLRRAGRWVAGFDRWGQVVLLNADGKLTLTVVVRRELAAAWLPDGTRWGSAALLGGPPHPDAAERIGQALAAGGVSWK